MRHLILGAVLALSSYLAIAHPVAASPPVDLTEADLATFLDDFFARELSAHRVVGASIVVVHDGRVLGSGGYGFADREAERPVDAAHTVFPAQSVSKLFAATAVMQAAQRGLVDLGADVRTYLDDLSVDSRFATPVTLAHLLTHTAGFDDSYIGFLPREADGVLPVAEFLERHRRRVVFEPGTVHAYSNYGSLLARHAIENAVGRDYEDLVREEIFDPLGMRWSCVLPPPREWADRVATGYVAEGDDLVSTRDLFPDGLIRFRTRTGTVGSTVLDMARFMIAHLDEGRVDGVQLLAPATVARMHRQGFAQHPRVPGVALGFFESVAGGQRGLFHFGAGFGYGTLLYLLPEHRTGFYIAHSNHSSRIAEAFLTAFMERYFEAPADPATSTQAFDDEASRFAGYYLPVRRAETTFEKLPLAFAQAQFRATGPQSLATDRFVQAEWQRTGPRVFEREGGGIVAFAVDDAGRPTLASAWDAENPQLLVLERLPWYDTTPALAARLAWFLVVLLAVVLAVPIAALLRRRRAPADRPAPILGAPAFGAALVHLAFFVGVAWIFVGRQWFFPIAAPTVAIFCLPFVAVALTAVAVVRAVRRRDALTGRRVARVAQVVTLATLVLLPLFLWRWNLLGFYF